MPRHVAFLRGVSPQNARSADLQRAFEAAGFTSVRAILSSGNVVFDAPATPEPDLEQQAEAALQATLGRSFLTIVRPSTDLAALLARDPFAAYAFPPEAKRVVSFLRAAREPAVPLPLAADGACLLGLEGRELLTAYVPSPKGPVFMQLIERAFGKDVTTRTWDTVRRCASA